MLITALKHQPDMANALLVLGDVYRSENRWDSACYYLHQAIEYGDIYKQHSAYRHLSSIEIQKHNYPQTTTYLRQAQLLADSIKEDYPNRSDCQNKTPCIIISTSRKRTIHSCWKMKRRILSYGYLAVYLWSSWGVAISVYFHYKKKVQNTRLQMHKLSKLKEEQEAMSMKAHEENICKIKELEQKQIETEPRVKEIRAKAS